MFSNKMQTMDIDYENDINNPFANLNISNKNSSQDTIFPPTDYTSTYENSNSMIEIIKKVPIFNYKKVMKRQISTNEIRLIRDIQELKKNEGVGKICQVNINDYNRIQDTDNLRLIVEFINYFCVDFIFTANYPFEPPMISFHSGNKIPFIFDSDGNIILEEITKLKWTPTFWLSDIIKGIESLVSKCPHSLIPRKIKYTKRKWNDYIEEEKSIFNNSSVINDLIKSIKDYKNIN